MVDVEILLFEGFDELDAIGPYEVFDAADARGASFDASLVTLDDADAVTASHGTTVVPDGALGNPDLLVVPGGGWSTGGGVRREFEAGRAPDAIAERHAAGATVASVCTGALLLAAAGLLDDRPATTHHTATADLEEYATLRDARVVDAGDVLTAGGITSGLDLALWIVERTAGAEVAERVARNLEYGRSDDVVVVEV